MNNVFNIFLTKLILNIHTYYYKKSILQNLLIFQEKL